MPRRSTIRRALAVPTFPGATIVVLVLLAAQVFLPILHSWHEATAHGSRPIVATASETHRAPPAHSKDKDDDQSTCSTCQAFFTVRQAIFVPGPPPLTLIQIIHESPILAPGFIVIDGVGLSVRTARGPPAA